MFYKLAAHSITSYNDLHHAENSRTCFNVDARIVTAKAKRVREDMKRIVCKSHIQFEEDSIRTSVTGGVESNKPYLGVFSWSSKPSRVVEDSYEDLWGSSATGGRGLYLESIEEGTARKMWQDVEVRNSRKMT